MISVEEALRRITKGVPPAQQEHIPLLEADGRTLAEDLSARITQPPFDASAMDGYAVRAHDVATLPATLAVIGEAAAGHGFSGKVGIGQAVRIFTGAPLPDGADAIVIQENATRSGSQIIVTENCPDPRHIRHQGIDFRKGAHLLKAGSRLTPRSITLAAAMGYADLPVRRKPTVALIATGDELTLPGAPMAPHNIICSNPFGIAGVIERAGGRAAFLGIARDERTHLAGLCAAGLDADILVTIGGASVGDHDIVAEVLQSQGMVLDFWRIAMRPGKPLMFGKFQDTRVIGLPGSPVSALICTRIFIVPLLEALLGYQTPATNLQTAIVTEALPQNGPRQHYMRAISQGSGDDQRVTPVKSQDSSLLSTLAAADVLVVRAPHAPVIKPGERVNILPLDF